ncbi:MAG: ABC transporter ATP-binding protein [Nitrospirae bacterium]|nr:ABC transporter ATP-binding protein [Nitrospirota bacterium]
MVAIQIDKVSKKFRKYTNKEISTIKDLFVRGIFRKDTFETEIFWALRDISFAIPNGKMVGIIGSNGSGKSTLLKLLAGIMGPTTGNIRINGRISALIELGAGFHPELSGRENIFINGIILGLSKKEIQDRFNNIVKFAGLEDFIDSPVKTYSSGMYMRLGFAIAINVDPDILLIDEILAVGDEEFQHKCLNKINEFKRRGKTLVFVSHDLGSVERLCDEVIWLANGVLKASGLPRMVIDKYTDYVASFEEERAFENHQRALDELRKDSPNRWGTKEVEITGVKLTDGNKKEKYLFEYGEPIKIVLNYKANKRIEDPVFGIGIFRDDGVCVYGTNTAIDGFSIDAIEGIGNAVFSIEKANLVEGSYLLDVAVHKRDGLPYDYQSRLYSFIIRSKVKDIGIYRPDHSWSMISDEV